MDFGGVAIELGSRGLDGELPVDLDRLGAALVEQGQHLSYRQSIRYHLGMQENLVYGLLMVFEEIFRSPDIHSCYALLRRVHCLHAGSCTCALRSGRPAKTGAITPPRPLYANGRRRFCASRPAHRPPSRLVRAYCVRAIRKPSLADGIAGTPRASQASPSGTDAGARPRVSPDRRDPKTAATEVEHPVRRNCGRADGLRRARPWTPSAAGWRGSATPRCAESPASGIGWDSPGRAPAGMGLALIPTLWLTCRSVRTWRRMRAHSSHAVTVDWGDVTVTQRPPLANGDGRAGADPVRAERSRAINGDLRSVGRVDVVTGRVSPGERRRWAGRRWRRSPRTGAPPDLRLNASLWR